MNQESDGTGGTRGFDAFIAWVIIEDCAEEMFLSIVDADGDEIVARTGVIVPAKPN
jgi:hypothetical protein